jgi:hypothetical protein
MTMTEIQEAAAVLRRLLSSIDAGELRADGAVGAGIVRQLRGAVTALDAVTPPDRRIH